MESAINFRDDAASLRDHQPKVDSKKQSNKARFWLSAIAEASGDAIIGKDLRGYVMAWNHAAEAMFGYEREEIIDHPITRIFPEERLDDEVSILCRLHNGEKRIQLEAERKRKDGTVVRVSFIVTAVSDQQGKLIGTSRVVRDITNQIRESSNSGSHETLLRAILETMPDALIVLDQHGAMQFFSAGAVTLFGYGALDVIGQNVSMVMPFLVREMFDGFLTNHRSAIEQHVIGGDRLIFGQRQNGTTFPIELTIRAVTWAQGRSFVTFVRDLTGRHQREALRSAKHSNNANPHFLAEATQELCMLLDGILGHARSLRVSGGLSTTQEGWVSAVLADGEHLLELIGSARELSRIEVEHIGLKMVACSVRAIAEACLGRVMPVAEAKKLPLSIAVSSIAPKEIITDPARLEQVILNLLRNAVRCTTRGLVELCVRPVVYGTGVRIEVTDTGPGMSAEDREMLFQGSGHSDTTITRGGLALALVVRLTALMGGRLGHMNNPGGGSIFWMEFPLTGDDPSSASTASVLEVEEVPSSNRILSVLVVDDVMVDRDVAVSHLRLCGHTVVSVGSGAEAVSAVSSHDFDFVLMDVRMPGMDGMEATRGIRALNDHRRRVPILAVTADVNTNLIAECRDAGMNSFLTKPYDFQMLRAAITRITDAKVAHREDVDPVSIPITASIVDVTHPEGMSLPILDPKAFEQIRSTLAPEKITVYLNGLAERCDGLLRCLRDPDALTNTADEVGRISHDLAGSAGLFGFTRLASVGARFEQALEYGGMEVPGLAHELGVVIDATLAEIDDRLRFSKPNEGELGDLQPVR